MTMSEAWQEIVNWIDAYVGGKPIILVAAICSAVYLLIANKSIRNRMIIPILVLIPIVINPILYKLKYYDLRYWRFFWILPDVLLISLAFADIAKRIRNQWIRCAALLVMAGLLVLQGANVFVTKDDNPFLPADSVRKSTADCRIVCETILADNPHPKCVFNDWLITETRQYSGDIIQMYGRDVDGFIIPMDPTIRSIADVSWYTVKEKNWPLFFKYVRDENYTHLCLRTDNDDDIDSYAREYGYEVLSQLGNKTIYRKSIGNSI